jgi:hypothetical protein
VWCSRRCSAPPAEARPATNVDAAAHEAGWQVPDRYTDLKANDVPILGTAGAMHAAANAAGLAGVMAGERPVDAGVTRPEQLISYRLGQPLFAGWLDRIGPRRAGEFASHAADVIHPVMQPYRPIVVFLAVTTPTGPAGHPDLDATS